MKSYIDLFVTEICSSSLALDAARTALDGGLTAVCSSAFSDTMLLALTYQCSLL
jgi:hypothetical protein